MRCVDYAIVCAALVGAGCGGSGNGQSPPGSGDVDPHQLLSDAGTQIAYSDLTVYLDSFLYVDNMPGTEGPAADKFIASLKLKSVQGTIPPPPPPAATVYIFEDGALQWRSASNEPWRSLTGEKAVEKVFRNGPSVLQDKVVDVLLEFSYEGEVKYIKQDSLNVSPVY